MRYALIANGLVDNIIELHPDNAQDFPGAVPGEIAAIGDEYRDGRFWRNGELVKTAEEIYADMAERLADAQAALAELGVEQEDVGDV